MGIAAEIGEHLLGSAEGRLGVDDQSRRRNASSRLAKAAGCPSLARSPQKTRLSVSKALRSPARNRRRKRRDRTRTGRKKPFLQATQRLPSTEGPPPDTTQWTWG